MSISLLYLKLSICKYFYMYSKYLLQAYHFLALHPIFFLLLFQIAGIYCAMYEFIALIPCLILLVLQKHKGYIFVAIMLFFGSYIQTLQQIPKLIHGYIPIKARLDLKEVQEATKNHRHVYKLKSQALIISDNKSFSLPVTHYLGLLEQYSDKTLYSGKLCQFKQRYYFIHNKKELTQGLLKHRAIQLFQKKKKLMQSINKHSKQPLLAHLYTHLLIGQAPLDTFISELFCQFGLTHILVISGFHFSLMLLLFYWILKPLIPKKVLHISLIIISIAFYIFIGKSPSMLRALICIIFLLIAKIHSQPIKPLNALSLAALISLSIDPSTLHQVGFKLTFLATFAILIVYQPTKKLLEHWLQRRTLHEFQELNFIQKHLYLIMRILVSALALNLSVFIMTTPTILYHMQSTPLNGLIYNIFIPFMISLILPPLMILLLVPQASLYILALIEPIAKSMLDLLYFAPTRLLPNLSTELLTAPIASLTTLILATLFLTQHERYNTTT